MSRTTTSFTTKVDHLTLVMAVVLMVLITVVLQQSWNLGFYYFIHLCFKLFLLLEI